MTLTPRQQELLRMDRNWKLRNGEFLDKALDTSLPDSVRFIALKAHVNAEIDRLSEKEWLFTSGQLPTVIV